MALKINKQILLLIGLVILLFTMSSKAPLEAVENIEGVSCDTDADCPCWGTYATPGTNANITARGIGIASCEDHKCNVDLCIDVEPVGTWIKNNPFQYLKKNPLMLFTLIGLLILVLSWPQM